MIVERIPESLTWVPTSVIPRSSNESSRRGNVPSPVSATATIASGHADIDEESVSDGLPNDAG